MEKKTLHETMIKLLKQKGIPMSATEIATELNKNKWYIKKDKSPIIPYQIVGRVKKYSHLFNKNGTIISLHEN